MVKEMVKVGIIGTNWITEQFLASAQTVEGFELAAVYSRTEERAKEFAEKYGVTAIFTDLEEMASSDVIDAVYIASPTSFHASQSTIFLKNGKHVLCEKPVASNQKELDGAIEAAKANNALLMEAMRTTLTPNFLNIKENLHKIGKVRRVFANYCQYSSRYDAYREGTVLNAFRPEFSNGSMMDLGVYCFHPIVALFGKPLEVKGNAYMLESGVDGEGSALLKYEDMDAVVMYSKITNSSLPSEIQGEDGNIIINHISNPTKITIQYRDGRTEDISVPQRTDDMYYEAKEFIDLIQSGETESKINSLTQSKTVLAIMDEVRKQIGLVYPADKN